jgi:pilus assembly protein FimV
MGAQIDPNNPLYGGAGGGAAPSAPIEAPAPAPKPDLDFDINQSPSAAEPSFDLDLDTQKPVAGAAGAPDAGLDFDINTPSAAAPVDLSEPEPAKEEKSNFDFDLSGLDFPSTKTPEAEKTSMNQTAALNLADLNLDDSGGGGGDNEAVGTKLELAKAYLEIGDKDGAREILQEVAKEGSSAQKEEAKKLIASL